MRRDGDVTYRCFQRLSRAGNEVACLSQYFSTRRSSRQLNHLHNVIVLSCRLSSSINWSGERPIRLDDGRYFVVVGALCQGRYALFDTESLELVPFNENPQGTSNVTRPSATIHRSNRGHEPCCLSRHCGVSCPKFSTPRIPEFRLAPTRPALMPTELSLPMQRDALTRATLTLPVVWTGNSVGDRSALCAIGGGHATIVSASGVHSERIGSKRPECRKLGQKMSECRDGQQV